MLDQVPFVSHGHRFIVTDLDSQLIVDVVWTEISQIVEAQKIMEVLELGTFWIVMGFRYVEKVSVNVERDHELLIKFYH